MSISDRPQGQASQGQSPQGQASQRQPACSAHRRWQQFCWSGIGGLLGAVLLSLPVQAAQLERWRFDGANNRLEFTTDIRVQPQAQLIFNPTRVVVDLPGIRLGRPKFEERGNGPIQVIRFGQFDAQTTRIVVELAPGYTLDPQRIQIRGITSTNWVIELPRPQLASASDPGGGNPVTPPGGSPPTPGLPGASPGAVSAPTQVSEVRATPDGLFVRTSGQSANPKVARSRDRRSISIDLAASGLSSQPLPLPSSSELARFGIQQLSAEQVRSTPPLVRLTLRVNPDSPDWQATASNLGGVILLPQGAVSAVQPLPPSRNIPIVQRISLDSRSNQVIVQTDQPAQTFTRIQGGETQLILSPARLAPGVSAPRPGRTDPLQRITLREEGGQSVIVGLQPAPGFSIGQPQALNAQLTSVPLVRSGSIAITPPSGPVTLPPQRPTPSTPIPTVPPPADPFPPTFPPSGQPQGPIDLPGAPSGRALVTIDPGHGGPDPGAIGIGGLRETDVVLDISRQVQRLLERNGVQVIMTRTGEYDVDLEPRVVMANRSNSTLFVSIHANAISMSRPEVNGLETYYFSSGKALAETIHQSVLEGTGIGDRGVRQSRFYVLRRTSMPSVLVETGFLTGARDARLLADSQFRTRMAEAIARGILRYLRS